MQYVRKTSVFRRVSGEAVGVKGGGYAELR